MQEVTKNKRDSILKVPTKISYGGGLGRSVAFSQLISTWANSCSKNRITTTLPIENHNALEEFTSRLHGLTATYYADQITAKDGTTDLRKRLLSAAVPRIEAMAKRKFSEVARGPMTEFVFVNRARHQFHSVVYLQNPAQADLMDPQRHGNLIVSPREMNALILNALRAQNLLKTDLVHLENLITKNDSPLGHLLHETFRNTAEHAYLDIHGKVPQRGIRCILIAARKSELGELDPQALLSTDHPHVEEYFEQLRNRSYLGTRKKVHILELSIFDTGPGFISTISNYKHPDSNADDSYYVTQCFLDNVSSKSGKNSGLGLGRVLSRVSELDGFIRVRTSTTEAFFSSQTKKSNCQLVPHVVGNLPKATGTVITIALPLRLS